MGQDKPGGRGAPVLKTEVASAGEEPVDPPGQGVAEAVVEAAVAPALLHAGRHQLQPHASVLGLCPAGQASAIWRDPETLPSSRYCAQLVPPLMLLATAVAGAQHEHGAAQLLQSCRSAQFLLY